MPQAPLKPCKWPCPNRVESGLCPACSKAKHQRIDANRGTSTERGYGNGWDKVRVQVFIRDGWRCVDCHWEPELVRICRESGLPMPATATVLEILRIRYRRKQVHLDVDHIIPIEQRPDLRLELSNLATLCDRCHKRKSRNEMMEARA